MYRISKDFVISAGHFIRGHQGPCANLHGHNYKVRVTLGAPRLDELGMVVDFSLLKATLEEVLAPFDHRVLNEVAPFDQRNTTAELLAETVFEEVERRLSDERVSVERVEVWENETSSAAFDRR